MPRSSAEPLWCQAGAVGLQACGMLSVPGDGGVSPGRWADGFCLFPDGRAVSGPWERGQEAWPECPAELEDLPASLRVLGAPAAAPARHRDSVVHSRKVCWALLSSRPSSAAHWRLLAPAPRVEWALCSQPSFSAPYLSDPRLRSGPFAATTKGGSAQLPGVLLDSGLFAALQQRSFVRACSDLVLWSVTAGSLGLRDRKQELGRAGRESALRSRAQAAGAFWQAPKSPVIQEPQGLLTAHLDLGPQRRAWVGAPPFLQEDAASASAKVQSMAVVLAPGEPLLLPGLQGSPGVARTLQCTAPCPRGGPQQPRKSLLLCLGTGPQQARRVGAAADTKPRQLSAGFEPGPR